MDKKDRQARWGRCEGYLHLAGSLPAAMRLARQDGFAVSTSVWITALVKMLSKMSKGK